MKPNIKKSDSYQEGKEFNYAKFYSEGFEVQLGNDLYSVMHFHFSYYDSTYKIDILNFDSPEVQEFKFKGKAKSNMDGTITLIGDSPFKNNQYQIVMHGGMGTIFAKFKLNDEFKEKFPHPHRWKYAYCEAESYSVEDCYSE